MLVRRPYCDKGETYALFGGDGGAAQDGASQGHLACSWTLLVGEGDGEHRDVYHSLHRACPLSRCGVGEAHDAWCADIKGSRVQRRHAGKARCGADDHVRIRFKLNFSTSLTVRLSDWPLFIKARQSKSRALATTHMVVALLMTQRGPDRLPCCAGQQKAFSDDRMMKKSRAFPGSFTTIPRRPVSHAERV
jgi:hypothetical protein